MKKHFRFELVFIVGAIISLRPLAYSAEPGPGDASPAPHSTPEAPRATPTRPAASASNLVEPLSNGLRLAMTQNEIVAKFGEPTGHTFDARTFGYASFDVMCGGAQAKIWHLTLKQGVKLSSGLGAGSTRAEVERVFGPAPAITTGQYKLSFRYAGDRVTQIKIDPVNREFVDETPKSAAGALPQKPVAPAALTGTWYGAGDTRGTIELHDDGTYSWSGKPAGRYSVAGETITFTGSLAAWNKGIAKLNARRDNFEFYWVNDSGGKQWFVFIR